MEGESNKLAGEVDTRNGFIPVVSPITQKRKSTKKVYNIIYNIYSIYIYIYSGTRREERERTDLK